MEEIKNVNAVLHAPSHQNQDRILTMMAFIHDRYPERLTLQDIADSAAISTRECLRCFRSSIGQSPMDYLIEYRIRTAMKLLETTSLSISDIAMHTGFNSSAYFTKMFRRIYGKTPNACRKELDTLRSGTM